MDKSVKTSQSVPVPTTQSTNQGYVFNIDVIDKLELATAHSRAMLRLLAERASFYQTEEGNKYVAGIVKCETDAIFQLADHLSWNLQHATDAVCDGYKRLNANRKVA